MKGCCVAHRAHQLSTGSACHPVPCCPTMRTCEDSVSGYLAPVGSAPPLLPHAHLPTQLAAMPPLGDGVEGLTTALTSGLLSVPSCFRGRLSGLDLQGGKWPLSASEYEHRITHCGIDSHRCGGLAKHPTSGHACPEQKWTLQRGSGRTKAATLPSQPFSQGSPQCIMHHTMHCLK